MEARLDLKEALMDLMEPLGDLMEALKDITYGVLATLDTVVILYANDIPLCHIAL
jgi:hypothetical protein